MIVLELVAVGTEDSRCGAVVDKERKKEKSRGSGGLVEDFIQVNSVCVGHVPDSSFSYKDTQ